MEVFCVFMGFLRFVAFHSVYHILPKKNRLQAQEDVGPDAEALWVWFANVDHLYFARDGLAVAEQKLHPHGHGWSLVNNVDQWTWE